MWLLDTLTLQHCWFHDPPTEEHYAILSHVWSQDGEQSFQDIKQIVTGFNVRRARRRWWRSGGAPWRGQQRCVWDDDHISAKIRNCCAVARAMGYRYVWIDSCCIDQTNSEQLSEAINSMFQWYSSAAVCFAFLEDVDDAGDPADKDSSFRRSRWFTRGWTLQELIAPREVLFLSKTWTMLGTKQGLADAIEAITGIEHAVLLLEKPLDAISVACRMSWASRRETTRVEDEAYCLLGLFGIRMATTYGEGRNAFIRLQEEILRQIPDQSIFVWGWDPTLDPSTFQWPPHAQRGLDRGKFVHRLGNLTAEEQFLLAPSPLYFQFSGCILPITHDTLAQRLGVPCMAPHYVLTSYGVRSRLPLIQPPDSAGTDWYLAALACQDDRGQLMALVLKSAGPDLPGQYTVGRYNYGHDGPGPRLVALQTSPSSVSDFQSVVEDEVYIAHRPNLRPMQAAATRARGRRHMLRSAPRISLTIRCDDLHWHLT
ncbi:HET-domain-containing protein [Cubamyces sp. BRFM 1775]|nr:HET-domain-containing protein [Cubamyces sp. BRFM 1775]